MVSISKPNLFIIDPKTYLISWVYVFLNIGLGVYMMSQDSQLHYLIVNNIITFDVWGALFILLGFVNIISLLKNHWEIVRYTMIAGFALKLFWALALIWVAMDVGFMRILASISMWFSLAAIQAIVIIYFVPKIMETTVDGRGRS